MAGNCKIMPAMLPVAVPVSIDGSSDAGGTIWRRKYRALKKKCEEFEQMNEVLCAQTRRMHVMIERAEAEKRFLIKRLERYEVVEFPPKVPKLLSFDDAAIKAEVRSGIQKKEARAMCPPPALLGPFPSSKPQQEYNSPASSATLTTVSTVTQYTAMANTVLPQLISQASPKTKPSATTGTSAPKQKRTTKTTAGGRAKRESGSTRKRKSDVDPLAPKKPSNAFFWFCQEYRPGLQEHFKGEGMAGQHDLTKILAKLWSETKMEDRKTPTGSQENKGSSFISLNPWKYLKPVSESLRVAHEENGESTVTMATETSDSDGVREGEVVMGEPLSEPSTSSEERCQNEESLPPKRDGQETVDMDVGHSTPSSIPEESEEESAQSTSDPSKKEEAIRKFKLDPNAKEFSPLNFDTPSTASAVTTRASPSPTVSSISSSSLRSSPSALHFPSGGSGRPRDRYKSPARPHSHTPTTFLSQDSLLLTSTPASAGYIVTQPVSSGIVRPLAQVPSRPMMYGSPQYAHIPTGSTFMATPQVVSPKFDHLSAQPQMIVGQQLPLINQPQMFPGQAGVLPVSQTQGMMSIPQQQMMYMPGMPLQPAMTMPAVAGGFVQGHPTALHQSRTVPYQHQQHTAGK